MPALLLNNSCQSITTWTRRGGWVIGFQKDHTFPLRVEGWSLEFECPRGPKIWKKSRKYFIPLWTEKNIFQLLKLDYDKLLIINNVVPYGFERVLWVYLFFCKSIYLKTHIIHMYRCCQDLGLTFIKADLILRKLKIVISDSTLEISNFFLT